MSLIAETEREIDRTISNLKRKKPVRKSVADEYERMAWSLERHATDLRVRAQEARSFKPE
jgi:hypothetical protein